MSDKLIKLENSAYVTERATEFNNENFLSNLSTPEIYFDEEYGKWAMFFQDADSGGYDVEHFTFYYDSLETLLFALGLSKEDLNKNISTPFDRY